MSVAILLGAILLAPFSALLPVFVGQQISPPKRNRSRFVFFGPIVYAYGVVIAGMFGGLAYISGLLLQSQSPSLLGVSIVTSLGGLVFLFCTVVFAYPAYQKHRKLRTIQKQRAGN